MSINRAFREDQIKKLANIIRDYSNPEDKHLAEPVAHRIYNEGGRMVPLWVMVIWATLYTWWWILLIQFGCIVYFLIFAREEIMANPVSLIVPSISLAAIIIIFYGTYNELKKEQ
jgi:hypothetical protein